MRLLSHIAGKEGVGIEGVTALGVWSVCASVWAVLTTLLTSDDTPLWVGTILKTHAPITLSMTHDAG